MKIFAIILAFILCMQSQIVFAHSGKTNADGCHTNKKTNEYHCHSSKSTKVAKTTARTTAPTGKQTSICTANIYNCEDFSSRAEAQKTYETCLKQVGKDVHDLDRDKDGKACEALK